MAGLLEMRNGLGKYPLTNNNDWLTDKWSKRQMSAMEIEKEYHIPHGCIERAVARLGIGRKRRISMAMPIEDINKLSDMYLQREMSCKEISKELGYTEYSIWHALKSMGVKIRNQKELASEHCKRKNKLPISEETREKYVSRMSKERNPQWMGGLSYQPYGIAFDENLREQIRERDGRSCRICYEKENGKKLNIHHMDYDKNNNNSDNLISLCSRCHGLTAHNREQWFDYFSRQWCLVNQEHE